MILLKASVWLTVLVTVIVLGITQLCLDGSPWTAAALWRGLAISATLSSLATWAFERWLWKLAFLRGSLVTIPNIAGKWKGEIRSTWVDPATGTGVPSIPITATFRQTLLRLSMVVETPESRSDSINAKIECNSETGRIQLSAIYLNVPLQQVAARSAKHFGAVLLDMSELTSKEMSGPYWTDRKTNGELVLDRTLP